MNSKERDSLEQSISAISEEFDYLLDRRRDLYRLRSEYDARAKKLRNKVQKFKKAFESLVVDD